ncbi:hypothetical protein NC653_006997 [Populus alba x Populus x berolinensis]|uniref:Uncharacterized protein n=1 Tax=Populus alba x Populus x berolinensis TaxID=444605 RepID=A0AAD6WCW9_9ROSI|nr:hypothetical protein NC653_006997 [Populus alba x Populus x berolinensis]
MDSSNLNRLYVNSNMKRIKIGFRWVKLYPPFQVKFITEAFVFLMQQLDLMWKQFSTTISNFKYGILVSLLISLDL